MERTFFSISDLKIPINRGLLSTRNCFFFFPSTSREPNEFPAICDRNFYALPFWRSAVFFLGLYSTRNLDFRSAAMEDLKAALNDQANLVSELFEKLSAELRSGIGPAVDNFVGFFHAIDWKVSIPLIRNLVCISFFLFFS